MTRDSFLQLAEFLERDVNSMEAEEVKRIAEVDSLIRQLGAAETEHCMLALATTSMSYY